MPPRRSPEEDIDRLYSGELDQFTAERNALAKRLRTDGDKAAAEEVAKLRKPTVSAAVLNRLTHNHRKELDRFLAAADELQRAQNEALRGEGGERLRKAMRAERDAIDGLVEIARSGEASGATLDRVRETLEAAVTDPDARRLLEAGRIEKDLRPGGALPSSSASPRKGKTDAAPRRNNAIAGAERELKELSDRLEAAEQSETEWQENKAEAEERLKEARTELGSAKKAAQRLRRQVKSAKGKLDRVRKKG
jgi:hypothetical protein